MVIVVMGVIGAGKSTVGRLLASQLGWEFFDADDFHSPSSLALLARGVPLTDAEREPWLAALRALIAQLLGRGRSAALACSALTERYRELLLPPEARGGRVRFVYLRGDRALIAERLRGRAGHFASASLLDSQLALLEEPAGVLTLDARDTPESLVHQIRRTLADEGESASGPSLAS